jgi:hypothetical protein
MKRGIYQYIFMKEEISDIWPNFILFISCCTEWFAFTCHFFEEKLFEGKKQKVMSFDMA